MSANMPDFISPLSNKPKVSAVSLVCFLINISNGNFLPASLSLPQCEILVVGMLASQISPQCAPPSLPPATDDFNR